MARILCNEGLYPRSLITPIGKVQVFAIMVIRNVNFLVPNCALNICERPEVITTALLRIHRYLSPKNKKSFPR